MSNSQIDLLLKEKESIENLSLEKRLINAQ